MYVISRPFNRLITRPFNFGFGGTTVLNPALYWGNNLIRGYPDPTLADGTQPIWWNVTNDETLTEEDATGESITMSNERVLKLVISADGGGVDFAYQDFAAADEATLVDNVTIVSAGIEVYQKSIHTAGTVTLELYDVSGATSLGTATTTTQDSKVLLKVENVTYQDSMRFRLTHSANSAIVYATNPMVNIGPTLRPWIPRPFRYVSKMVSPVLSVNPSTTSYTDLDLSSFITPNTFAVFAGFRAIGAASWWPTFRYKGSAIENNSQRPTAGVGSSHTAYGYMDLMVNASGVVEWRVNSTSLTHVSMHLRGYWEWI